VQQVSTEVDPDLCIGSGECVAMAPQAFLLGPADSTVTLLQDAATVELELLRDAEMSCPTGAIRVVASD